MSELPKVRPGNLLRTSYANGVTFFWEVTAVLLGGENQDSVVELSSGIGRLSNEAGPIRIPMPILERAIQQGAVQMYEEVTP
jgi:hypothetical protein